MWGQDWGLYRHAVAAQAPKPRVVQHQHRRYSIRLEAVFWKFLDYLAARQGVRLGRYIAGLAASYGGNNLSSYLRVVCMLEAERSVAEAALDPTRDSLLALVRDCPSPGVIISRGWAGGCFWSASDMTRSPGLRVERKTTIKHGFGPPREARRAGQSPYISSISSACFSQIALRLTLSVGVRSPASIVNSAGRMRNFLTDSKEASSRLRS